MARAPAGRGFVRAIGKIGLRANESGFATQDLKGATYTVSGPYLTDGERSLLLDRLHPARRCRLDGRDSRRAATLYSPTTPMDLDAPLDIDAECAVMLGEWFAGMQQVLTRVFPDEEAPALARALRPGRWTTQRRTIGASPGDDHITQPYLYVGPADGEFTAMPFSALVQAGDPLAAAEGFFSRNRKLLG